MRVIQAFAVFLSVVLASAPASGQDAEIELNEQSLERVGRIADGHRNSGRHEENLEANLHIVERLDAMGDLDTEHQRLRVTALSNVATAHYELGQYAEAETVYSQVLRAREATLGPNDLLTAFTRLDLAQTLQRMGRFEESEALLLQILSESEDYFGPLSDYIRNTRHTLATQYFQIERYEEAAEQYAAPLNHAVRYGYDYTLHRERHNLVAIYIRSGRQDRLEAEMPNAISGLDAQIDRASAVIARKEAGENVLINGYSVCWLNVMAHLLDLRGDRDQAERIEDLVRRHFELERRNTSAQIQDRPQPFETALELLQHGCSGRDLVANNSVRGSAALRSGDDGAYLHWMEPSRTYPRSFHFTAYYHNGMALYQRVRNDPSVDWAGGWRDFVEFAEDSRYLTELRPLRTEIGQWRTGRRLPGYANRRFERSLDLAHQLQDVFSDQAAGWGNYHPIHLDLLDALATRHLDSREFTSRPTSTFISTIQLRDATSTIEVLLTITSREFGDSDPWTLRARDHQARLLAETREYGEALGFLQATLRLREAEHPETIFTAKTVEYLADLHRDQGRFEEAQDILSSTLADDRARSVGEAQSVFLRAQLLELLALTGQEDAARVELETLQAFLETGEGTGDARAEAGLAIATALHRFGAFDSAEAAYAALMEVRDTSWIRSRRAYNQFRAGLIEEAASAYYGLIISFSDDYDQTTLENLIFATELTEFMVADLDNAASISDALRRFSGSSAPPYIFARARLERALTHAVSRGFVPMTPPETARALEMALLTEFVYSQQTGELDADMMRFLARLLGAALPEAAQIFDGDKADLSELDNRNSLDLAAANLLKSSWLLVYTAGAQYIGPDSLLDDTFNLSQSFLYSSAGDALNTRSAILAADNAETATALEAFNQAQLDLEYARTTLSNIASSTGADPEDLNVAQRVLVDRQSTYAAATAALEAADINLADLVVSQTPRSTEIQAHLREGEALVYLSSIESTPFVLGFVATHDTSAVIPLILRPEVEGALIETVRSGLVLEAGDDYQLSSADLRDQPFDLEAAHTLYQNLIAPLGLSLLEDINHILVVSDGPLQTLPLHVLVSELPPEEAQGFERYRQARWLSEEFSFARLPSVSSLIAMRRDDAAAPSGERRLIGFGDPVLAGYDAPVQATPNSEDVFFQFANAAGALSVEGLPALRQTGVLLSQIQEQLELADEDIYLGPEADEETLMALNADGALRDFRTLTFATHALINDEIEGLDEPAIVLSPTPDNDGLLRASEIAQLDLDAQLVILAACNTAAADGTPGAEALSGLAKAFFYAGGRSLLVSNWPAEAGATAELIPDLVEGVEIDDLTRSRALQRAMNTLRDDHAFNFYAHPALWAPYMVVADQ